MLTCYLYIRKNNIFRLLSLAFSWKCCILAWCNTNRGRAKTDTPSGINGANFTPYKDGETSPHNKNTLKSLHDSVHYLPIGKVVVVQKFVYIVAVVQSFLHSEAQRLHG